MIRSAESVIRGPVASKHTVQLFDTSESLGHAVSSFLIEGCNHGTNLIVVARRVHWQAILRRMSRAGHAVGPLMRSGQLTMHDALQTLMQFMRQGRPVPQLFDAVVGSMVREIAARSAHGLRIYGEMVDILAEERNFGAVRQLEDLWNGLAARQSFQLLCGYSSAHFADPETAHLLPHICSRHTDVVIDDDDVLGRWVLKSA